ncbi:hypothetical protein, partial [Vulcanisaeta distributa]|uniref:hypothetical protein n=1 Tax=Vulcanisaeta distributa TaxID=164451 RepID=UPI0006CF42F3
EELRNSRAKVLISGEPFNEDKSFVVHLYTENLTIKVVRVAKSGNITITMNLTGLRGGFHVVVPKLFSDGKLRAMRYGLLLTDGSIDKEGYPVMATTQLWQIVAWLMAWSRRNYICVYGVNLNENDVTVTWFLSAVDHKNKVKSKVKAAKKVLRLDDDEFATFILFAVLGDGSVDVKWKNVRLAIGGSKYELWRDIVGRIMNLGFRDYDSKVVKRYGINSSKAVELAKRWLSDVLIRSMIEDLSQLPDAGKLRNLMMLANMDVKSRGKSSIEVIDGVKMHIHMGKSGYAELRIDRKRLEDAMAVQEALKRAGYNAKLTQRGKRFVVYIGQDEIKKHPKLIVKTCEILRKMHEEAMNEGKARRMKTITKAMKKLNCPRPGPTGLSPQNKSLLIIGATAV